MPPHVGCQLCSSLTAQFVRKAERRERQHQHGSTGTAALRDIADYHSRSCGFHGGARPAFSVEQHQSLGLITVVTRLVVPA